MRIYRSVEEMAGAGPVVATIGNFDGVHRGHRTVIEEVIGRARDMGTGSLAITFEPHPVRVLRPDVELKLITPLPVKTRLLGSTGVDALLVLPFTAELSRMSARAFAENVLLRGVKSAEVHEGENFRFGYNQEAGMDGLAQLGKELGFGVQVFAPMMVRGEAVSSSRIRALVARGAMGEARALLGREFAVESTPAPGRGFGTRYTVPTINLASYGDLLPANGVYVTTMRVGEEDFDAVTNVGNRPTFGEDSFTVESYLLDFHPIELTADTPLRLTFHKRLREERKWPTPEALKTQIGVDVTRARRFFNLARAFGRERAGSEPTGSAQRAQEPEQALMEQ